MEYFEVSCVGPTPKTFPRIEILGGFENMTLDLISDEDCIITENKRYMRLSVRQEIIEIHTEIMNNESWVR